MYKRIAEKKNILLILTEEETEEVMKGCELSIEEHHRIVKTSDTYDRYDYDYIVDNHIRKSPLVDECIENILEDGYSIDEKNLDIEITLRDKVASVSITGRKEEENV